MNLHFVQGHVLAGLALVSGPVWFAHGFGFLRRKRLIENTPTARIRSMAMGLVEVNGTVAARSDLSAPFSGRPCVYWQVEIAAQSGKRGWRTVHRNSSGQPFYLEDGTGAALVYPQGAECSVHFQVEDQMLGISLPDLYSDYIKANVTGAGLLWRLGNLRFRERILESTQRVYVLGTAAPVSKAVTISEGDELAATGTDDDRGSIRRRMFAESTVAVIRQGEHEKTFIISQDSERSVAFALGAKAMLGLIGGPLATLFGLGWWLSVVSPMKWFR